MGDYLPEYLPIQCDALEGQKMYIFWVDHISNRKLANRTKQIIVQKYRIGRAFEEKASFDSQVNSIPILSAKKTKIIMVFFTQLIILVQNALKCAHFVVFRVADPAWSGSDLRKNPDPDPTPEKLPLIKIQPFSCYNKSISILFLCINSAVI